uniref:Uncharacterized protein n=1 Tax=Anguilla anguilla TaxID=7936 RepID=A0A0E9V5T6_ANGAN
MCTLHAVFVIQSQLSFHVPMGGVFFF